MSADELIRRYESLKGDRAVWEDHWQQIAELVSPMRADFNIQRTAGEKRSSKIFDGTPGLAAENLASGLWGLVTNSANEWFEIQSEHEDINEDYASKVWLDIATQRMRGAFAAGGMRFYARAVDLYFDLVTLGTGIFFCEEEGASGRMFYSCRSLAECFIAEDDRETVDTVFRRFQWSARQAQKRWGDKVGKEVKAALEKNEPDRKFEFLHAVYPREDYDNRAGPVAERGKAFKSCYVDVEGKALLAEGGYYEFPYQVPRWSMKSGGVYGDSPAMLALPDTKMLNTMAKTSIVAAQKIADPPVLAADEVTVRGLRMTPGGTIYGGVDEQGRARYQPFQSGGDVGLTLEMMQQRREAVREAFYYSLLIMVQQPNATATEFLMRNEEKMRLMGPHLGRLQMEFLDPLIDRQFNVMARAGAFPPPPPALAQYPQLKIEYVSPLARAQKATDGAAIVRTLNSIAPLAAAKPEVWDNFETDKISRGLSDAYGMPAYMLTDPRRVAQIRAQRERVMRAQAVVTAAAPVAGAAKDAADAFTTLQRGGQGAQ